MIVKTIQKGWFLIVPNPERKTKGQFISKQKVNSENNTSSVLQ